MEKSNEATPLRPEGDRLLNAPLVEMDLNKFMQQIKDESTWKESDHNSITIFKSEYMTMVLIGMHEKAELKKHSAAGNMTLQVIEGAIDFMVEEAPVRLQKGQMLALKADISHSVTATEETFILLTVLSSKRSAV